MSSARRGPAASLPTSASVLALWAPVGLYMALIFWASSLPSPPSPAQVGDKVQHFAAYAGLGLVTIRATAGGRIRGLTLAAVGLAWAIAAVYGVTDEWHQAYVPGRTSDIADVAADWLGAGLAAVGAGAFGIIARSRRGPDAH
ncbi:MAG: VanZ family protein [Vicinamibacterales bacterium]